jgi:hypothetical protein
LRAAANVHGYLAVSLWQNNVGTTWDVHRLVARAFLGAPQAGQEVLHGPGGPSDNRLENLRYGTSQENNNDQLRDGTRLRGESRWNARLTDGDVRNCRERHAAGESQASLARAFGMSRTAIHNAIHGKNWGHVA